VCAKEREGEKEEGRERERERERNKNTILSTIRIDILQQLDNIKKMILAQYQFEF